MQKVVKCSSTWKIVIKDAGHKSLPSISWADAHRLHHGVLRLELR